MTYKNPVCRGSYVLGSACGRCERCEDERRRLAVSATGPLTDLSATAICPQCGTAHPPDLYLGNGNVVDHPCDGVAPGPLNTLARECHAANAHWWQNPATGERITRNKQNLLMLVTSELCEAMEGERKSLNDDHLPHRRMAEVELADTLIRLFDYAGAYGYDLDGAVALHLRGATPTLLNGFAWYLYNVRPPAGDKGEALFAIVKMVAHLGLSEEIGDANLASTFLGCAFVRIFEYAGAHGYDLDGAVVEKRAYNATRVDHQAEARLAANGKKW